MVPRRFGGQLDAGHPIVKNAQDIWVADGGKYPVGRKAGKTLTLGGTLTYNHGRDGPQIAGGSSGYLATGVLPTKYSTMAVSFGGIVMRRGSKTTLSGREVLIGVGDGNAVSSGVYGVIEISDGSSATTGLLIASVRLSNGAGEMVVSGPAMNTDGKPHAVAVHIYDDHIGTDRATVDFWVDGVRYTATSGSIGSVVDEFGTLAIGSVTRLTTPVGWYMTSASAVSMAWIGRGAERGDRTVGSDCMHRDWTDSPWDIFGDNRRHYWLTTPAGAAGGAAPGNRALLLNGQ